MIFGIFNILTTKFSSLNYWSSQTRNQIIKEPGTAWTFSLFQEFILTLVRLLLGIFEFIIADSFEISKIRLLQIFITWIPFMLNEFVSF